MILLTLFLTFLKIGALTFGGGMAMIPLIREAVLSNGWLTEEEFLDFVAVSESTPGPIAVNMATFVGADQAGFLGALVCTLGVVLPSFVIILLIAALMKTFLKNRWVSAALSGIRPCVVGLILGAGALMLLSVVFRLKTVADPMVFDLKSILFFVGVVAVALGYRLIRKKKISSIVLILISAAGGILVFGLLP